MKTFTIDEVEGHDVEEDMWIVLGGKVSKREREIVVVKTSPFSLLSLHTETTSLVGVRCH